MEKRELYEKLVQKYINLGCFEEIEIGTKSRFEIVCCPQLIKSVA